jgi:hypothetical protein
MFLHFAMVYRTVCSIAIRDESWYQVVYQQAVLVLVPVVAPILWAVMRHETLQSFLY